jgi:tetratricopeptide (TPR) repeat protein
MIDLQQGLPVGVLTRIREHPEDVDANIIALNVSDAYLDMLYRRGTEHAATAVRLMLKHRTRMQDEAAASLLRDHLRLPIGSSEDRHGMLTELRDGGFIGWDEVVDFWDRGKLTQLRLFSIEVHREPSESRLPPELEPLMDASVTASYEGRRKDAEAPLRTILEKLPNHPVALGNLAVLRGADGAQDEATALLEQAVKADPNYLFARCSLARQRIQAGDLDAADALLEGHMEHRRIHIQDLINLYGALAMLSSARGDNAQARGFLDTLKPLIQDDNEAKRLTEARILAIRASPDGSLMRELFSDALTDED